MKGRQTKYRVVQVAVRTASRTMVASLGSLQALHSKKQALEMCTGINPKIWNKQSNGLADSTLDADGPVYAKGGHAWLGSS